MKNIASLVLNYSTLLGGGRSSRVNGRTLRVRNYKKLLLAALLIGAASTAFAWEPCGTNLQYEIDGSGVLRFNTDPDQPATVANSAFKENTTITSFTLPENVTQIGSQAFFRCTSLADIDLSNVQDISSYAFDSCFALTQVVIPPTVTNIGVHAFYRCENLSSVLCRPQAAPTLGTDGFTHCASGLQICVPVLGGPNGYKSQTDWSDYQENMNLCFLDEYDEQTTTAAKITMFRDYESRTEIDLFRTLRKAGCFNTLTLPFSVALSGSPLDRDNVEVYEFAGATVVDGTLQLDITPLVGNSLSAGTPYLIQWPNTGEVMNRMHFSGITWDTDQTADNAGSGDVLFRGFYGKTHVDDEISGEQHLNLFLGGGNQLYWPEENDATSMLGFRAWFQITNSGPSYSPVRRGMPATLRIVATPTAIDEISSSLQGEGQSPIERPVDGRRTNFGGRLVLRNGQLVIIRNGQTFSLNGQKL